MTAIQAQRTEPLWFINDVAHVLIDGEASDGAFALLELRKPHGDMPPLHVHHRDDETFYVLEGEVSLFVGDQRLTLTAGQAALAPRGIPHTYRVESAEARTLLFTAPASFEAFVRAVSEPAPSDELPPSGRPLDPEALARTAAEYGIEILGPPGALPST
jgi:mannose-6-phosphate isomerase-like protein (cupin superfamily)